MWHEMSPGVKETYEKQMKCEPSFYLALFKEIL